MDLSEQIFWVIFGMTGILTIVMILAFIINLLGNFMR